ncbi:MAG: YkgJ family cysteine cluster protein [Blautia sp.]|nr:YkgJ family cysteine cluster protein [Blautia sp.]
MIREVDIGDISDGKFYQYDDLVKVGCSDCEGCSACCHEMGASILLDPLDVHRLGQCLDRSFDQLLDWVIELNIVDGLILPNLKMSEEKEACPFLNQEERCSIHPYRPGLCRLFPMGRFYEDGSFRYFLQKGQCKKKGRYKLRLRQWLDTPDLISYDAYITEWHYFIRKAGEAVSLLSEEEQKKVYLYVIRLFYEKPYSKRFDFYEQFRERLIEAREVLDV